jgi:hypothetical protein
MENNMEYNWEEIEEEHEENMKSIRESFDSIQRSYNIIMGVMILWIGIEIGMML